MFSHQQIAGRPSLRRKCARGLVLVSKIPALAAVVSFLVLSAGCTPPDESAGAHIDEGPAAPADIEIAVSIPPADAAVVARLLDGSEEEATALLLELTQDVDQVVDNYATIIDAARSAEGAMDVERLARVASVWLRDRTGFSRKNDDRRGAMLEWMSACIGAMPPSATKQVVADSFVRDMDALLQTNKIPTREGLDMAFRAVYIRWTRIMPDVSPRPILELYDRYVDKSTEDSARYFFRDMRTVVFLARGKESEEYLAVIMQAFPEKNWGEEPMRLIFPLGETFPKPATRAEYESLFDMSDEELADVVREHAPTMRRADVYGQEAFQILEDRQARAEQGGDAPLLKLLDDGIQFGLVAGILLPEPVFAESPDARQKRIVDAILDACEKWMKEAPMDTNVSRAVGRALPACVVSRDELRRPVKMARATHGQERVVDLLCEAFLRIYPGSAQKAFEDASAGLTRESLLRYEQKAQQQLTDLRAGRLTDRVSEIRYPEDRTRELGRAIDVCRKRLDELSKEE